MTERHKLKSKQSLKGRAKQMEISVETGEGDRKTSDTTCTVALRLHLLLEIKLGVINIVTCQNV